MRNCQSYTFKTKKAQDNIARILSVFKEPMTAAKAADLLCMTPWVVTGYLSHLANRMARVQIVGNEGRAPVYKTVDVERGA